MEQSRNMQCEYVKNDTASFSLIFTREDVRNILHARKNAIDEISPSCDPRPICIPAIGQIPLEEPLLKRADEQRYFEAE